MLQRCPNLLDPDVGEGPESYNNYQTDAYYKCARKDDALVYYESPDYQPAGAAPDPSRFRMQ